MIAGQNVKFILIGEANGVLVCCIIVRLPPHTGWP